ncbi:MAG: hypothetical protein PHG03_01335 [Bacilli bacterium]|nr:hypothetical protein [Bacilli bacterium]MDD4795189.1 hypothetical protein [Bacilli bacterium]
MNQTEKAIDIRSNAIKKFPSLFNLIYESLDMENILWIKFRIKTVDSYLKRMNKIKCDINSVDDLIGFCIIVNNIEDCYEILKQIINIKKITINTVSDYIKKPCGKNHYQAIHVKFKWEDCFGEIQIKTNEMYNDAESSYYLYKK